MDPIHHVSMVTFVVALIAVMNPIGNAALYIGMSSDRTKHEQHRISLVASIAVAIILLLALWIGMPILNVFGINLNSFEAAGGLIVTLIGLRMIRGGSLTHGHDTKAVQEADKHKHSIAVVPLAIPIIAGPGSISTIIANAKNFPTLHERIELSFVMVGIGVFIGFVLFFAPFIGRCLGEGGMRIVTRVMGLLLTAIALQMLSSGLLGMFPGLGVAS